MYSGLFPLVVIYTAQPHHRMFLVCLWWSKQDSLSQKIVQGGFTQGTGVLFAKKVKAHHKTAQAPAGVS